MKLRLESFWSIALFTTAVTAFALGAAISVGWALYPADFATKVFQKKVVIVCIIAIPVSWAVGLILRKNMRLAEELMRLVNRDRLTDLATRDFFFTRLAMDQAAYGVSLMIDIDHFKRVNDRFGHLAGDAVIASVAHTLRAQLREQDIVCRFGGEEFLIFLHEATHDQGWIIAERMRVAIEENTVATGGPRLR